MNKFFYALCLISSAGSVMAQSSVTLFGVVDAGIARFRSTGAGHVTGLVSGGNSASRFGFRGTEDLGGGLAASFWLEGQLNSDVGGGATQTTGLDFARRSTVSIAGAFGELRMGRDFSASYLNMIAFDPWGQRGIGIIGNLGPATGGVNSYFRNSNAMAYFLPAKLGGLYGSVQVALGERPSATRAITDDAGFSTSAANAATDKTGDYVGARIGYNAGPVHVAASYGVYRDAIRSTRITGAAFYAEDFEMANLGASYDFKYFKPMFLVQQETVGGRGLAAPAFRFNTYSFGVTAPLGAGVLRAQMVRYDNRSTGARGDDASQYSIGYVYGLSARTSLYADFSRMKNKGAATYTLSNLGGSLNALAPTPGGSSTGYVIGVKHSF